MSLRSRLPRRRLDGTTKANQTLSDNNAQLKSHLNAATIQAAKLEHEMSQISVASTHDKKDLEDTKAQVTKHLATIKMGKELVAKLKRNHEEEMTQLQTEVRNCEERSDELGMR